VHEKLANALGQSTRVRPLAAFHFGVGGQDVIASAGLLGDAHCQEVARAFEDEHHVARNPSPTARIIEELGPGADFRAIHEAMLAAMTPDVTVAIQQHLTETSARMTEGTVSFRRFGIVYKSFFYFVRVYQDAAYVVAKNALGDRSASGSMGDALKERNPAHAWLQREAPGYLEWFAQWRDQRNRWKGGADYHVVGPAPNMGIGFLRYDEATRGVTADLAGEIVRLLDASTALQKSGQLVVALHAALV
jgi:hypothetical protein